MLDPAIHAFLEERKENWLKKKITSKTTADEEAALKLEANELFSLATWLPDAAKRAKQLSLVSHPAKFSHPSAKTTPIIATADKKTDGLIRTGNVTESLDVFGNAAAMDVYKFLSLVLTDERTVLTHLEQKTDEIQQQFSLPTATYTELADGLLAIKADNSNQTKTSDIVKQVYFPVSDNEYHLLSILTPSSLMFSLKQRINKFRFSEDAKNAREAKKNNVFHETGFAEIYNLSVIGFGGTKPQNASAAVFPPSPGAKRAPPGTRGASAWRRSVACRPQELQPAGSLGGPAAARRRPDRTRTTSAARRGQRGAAGSARGTAGDGTLAAVRRCCPRCGFQGQLRRGAPAAARSTSS